MQETCEMVQRERNSIRGAKQLLIQFRGDQIWIPCSALDSDVDDMIFDTSKIYDEIVRSRPSLKAVRKKDNQNGKVDLASPDDTTLKITVGERPSSEGTKGEASAPVLSQPPSVSEARKNPAETQETANGVEKATADTISGATARHDFEMQADVNIHTQDANHEADDVTASSQIAAINGESTPQSRDVALQQTSSANADNDDQERAATKLNTDDHEGASGTSVAGDPVATSTELQDVTMLEAEESQALIDELQPIAHRMTTRAQAQAVSDNNTSMPTRSPSVASSYVPPIHPIFLIPHGACSDRDLGLPPDEAEATRRILMSYVQKQEEVCRGADKLYNGLLKAVRMKKDVFDSCKAEGHIGEMSDGEDWYDKEEWGLEEDLRKGHDEEEDDAGTQHKKTRGRRA